MAMRFRSVVLGGLVPLLTAACGSRTGLDVPTSTPQQKPDLPRGSGDDAGGVGDSSGVADAFARDALPPIDVSAPVMEPTSDCPDAASTLVYVVSDSTTLMSFYPPMATFTTIGRIDCPAPSGFQPFSMAVDRNGIAYVLYASQDQSASALYRVSTATASCRSTPFAPRQEGFGAVFGMAFVKDRAGVGETLFVAEGTPPAAMLPAPSPGSCAPSSRLATINPSGFALSILGAINPTICSPELTGTGAGDLFAFYAIDANNSAIGRIDPMALRVTNESRLDGVAQFGPNGGAWAFGFWGGDFYTFTATAPGSGSVVTRFRPSDGSVAQVGRTSEMIVGAGVSTCAPQQ